MKKIKLLRFNILVMIAVGLFAVLATGNLAFALTTYTTTYAYSMMGNAAQQYSATYTYSKMGMKMGNAAPQCGANTYSMMDNMMGTVTDSAGNSYSKYYNTQAMVDNGIMMEMGNGTFSCLSLLTFSPPTTLPLQAQKFTFTITSWYQINR